MSLSPAVIDAMLAAGCSAEQIAAAVKADMADAEARKEAKRANNAERQRRFRQRHITDSNTDNALRDVTECDPPPPPLSPQTPHTPPPPPEYNIPAREKAPAKPEGVSDQTWRDFLKHRRAKKAPVSDTVLAGIKREAAKAGWTLEAVFAEVVTRGWQSFRADWVDAAKPQGRGEPSYLDHLLSKQSGGP